MSRLPASLPTASLAVLLLVCAAWSGPLPAATFRVDEAGSLPRESSAVLNWRAPVPSRSADDTLEGTTSVLMRLNVAAWMNRKGRLFLVFPEQAAPVTRLQWRTQGRLLSGEARPGQRVLVHDGLIESPWLEDRIELAIEARGDQLGGMQSLNFHFEIDVD
jgi:hypothetical protein